MFSEKFNVLMAEICSFFFNHVFGISSSWLYILFFVYDNSREDSDNNTVFPLLSMTISLRIFDFKYGEQF